MFWNQFYSKNTIYLIRNINVKRFVYFYFFSRVYIEKKAAFLLTEENACTYKGPVTWFQPHQHKDNQHEWASRVTAQPVSNIVTRVSQTLTSVVFFGKGRAGKINQIKVEKTASNGTLLMASHPHSCSLNCSNLVSLAATGDLKVSHWFLIFTRLSFQARQSQTALFTVRHVCVCRWQIRGLRRAACLPVGTLNSMPTSSQHFCRVL